jgi:phosphoadenosine phosphosulfate reductase
MSLEWIGDRRIDGAPPDGVMRWALETYRGGIALACSFGGATGAAALDMVARIDPTVPVYYLDTGLLFEETYALVERVRLRYGIDPIPVPALLTLEEQQAKYGPELWKRDPDACCHLRKVVPQGDFLKGYRAWISGIRRDQSPTRASAQPVEWDDRFGLVKINPFAHWDERQVWAYVMEHEVPYNELLDRGYPSIGCVPCTRALAAGEDARAGRWSGFVKTECGLHR